MSVKLWFEKIFSSLSYYAIIDSEEIRAELIVYLIFVAGAEGKIKYNPKNKLAMICRMLYRLFGIKI